MRKSRTHLYLGGISKNTATTGESIETKLKRVLETGEPIAEDCSPIFQERKAGVEAQYDIRTDRWNIAVEAMDKASRSTLAKRQEMFDKQAAEAAAKAAENGGAN